MKSYLIFKNYIRFLKGILSIKNLCIYKRIGGGKIVLLKIMSVARKNQLWGSKLRIRPTPLIFHLHSPSKPATQGPSSLLNPPKTNAFPSPIFMSLFSHQSHFFLQTLYPHLLYSHPEFPYQTLQSLLLSIPIQC